VQFFTIIFDPFMKKIHVQVKPGSSKNELIMLQPDSWQVKLRARPIDGEANEALIRFLSEQLGISKSKIRIEKGLKSRKKVVVIEG
jgi:uncharacterized protein (TIGR00251 family)